MREVERRLAASETGDLALLRRYEPIVRYTRGEEFLPVSVDWYLRQCSLWVCHPDGRRELLVEAGRVTPEVLAQPRRAGAGAVHYLVFRDPLSLADLSAFLLQEGVARLRDPRHTFRTTIGRLARVGYESRLVDALFSLSIYLRGRVPGDTAAAAVLTVRQQSGDGRHAYYGRVVRERGWVIIQYWLLYPFNNWRSGFHGGNDHEADWEMVAVYLYPEADGELRPAWVAYASHDFQGDELRRAWDDPELERRGDHPVVYAAAGSHACYFQPGEYLSEFEVPYLRPFRRLVNRVYKLWARTLRQVGEDPHPPPDVLRIPFVDYARGDGESIGPDQTRSWEPVPLDPLPAWVSQYPGLWGWYARDPTAGEDAPAGPMFNRDGSVRRSWYDPLGWAGLDMVPPPPGERAALERQIAAIEIRQAALDAAIAANGHELESLGMELAALRDTAHLAARQATAQRELAELREAADSLRRERAENAAVLEALAGRRARLADSAAREQLEAAERRAHLRHYAQPASPTDVRWGPWLEVWGAISISMLLIGVVALFVAGRQYLGLGLLALVGTFLLIEAVFRRELAALVTRVTTILAVVCGLLLVYTFFWQLAVLAVLAAGIYLLWENLSELRG